MKSMTAYACRESTEAGPNVSVELKGYNSRFLDLSIYLPVWLQALEPLVREYTASRFSRGKIEVSIRIREQSSDVSVSVNKAAAEAYYKALKDLALSIGIKEKPCLSHILTLEGVIETEKTRDHEKYRNVILPVLAAASDQFEAERIREGKHTEDDILSHLSILEKSLEIVSAHASGIEASIKKNIKARFEELLGDRFDENRILAETAVLLMKYTVSEEISRLSSHLSEFRLETVRSMSPGKKLDFLCQEINREINTIGSKSSILEVSRAVVEMKNALENIREQLRNVE
ncbi:MAG: YicC family protein [Treponema sp.]|jgi:uncharacterized protein (TIGR00255 family)|nr:YicC family protein [Treponema sp.]